LLHLTQCPDQENEDTDKQSVGKRFSLLLNNLRISKRQGTGKANISCNHVLKKQDEYAHRLGCVPKFLSVNHHCKSSPYYLNLNTLIHHCAKGGFLRIESRASKKLVEVPSKQPRINQHANALLIYSRAMHLDPPAVTHIPSGATAVCSIAVILSDTNHCLLSLSSGILCGVRNTGKCYILFLSLGFEHFFLHMCKVPEWDFVQLCNSG